MTATQHDSHRSRNHMLSILSADDFALIEPNLEAIAMPRRHVIESPNQPIKHVYFPEGGIVSVVASTPREHQLEVALIGREGMSGISVLLGDDRSANFTFVQIPGEGMRVTADDLRAVVRKSPSMQRCFLRFAQAFMIQTSHTAMANGRAKVGERLARWLLMAQDRLDTNSLPLTHEFLAVMLGVRRASVTGALRLLKDRDLISTRRGSVTILDYDGLKQLADGLYGIPEAEYLRLTGWHPEPKPEPAAGEA